MCTFVLTIKQGERMIMNKIIEKDIQEILSSDKIFWKQFLNTNCLITGANGMLPSYLVFTLLALNDVGIPVNVYALVRNRKKAEVIFGDVLHNPRLHLIVQDVCEPISINEPIHYIIHAASQASPKYYETDPVGTIAANVYGTYNTLSLARDKQVRSYLFFSSSEVYGVVPADKCPHKEEDYGYIDILKKRSCYCESKRLGENLCVAFHSQYKVPTKIARIYHTYGPTMTLDDGRSFSDFCKCIIEKRDIVLNSDGTAIRHFCYVVDGVLAYLKILLDGEEATAYNVANVEESYSIIELAQTLVDLFPERRLKIVQGQRLQITAAKQQSPIISDIPDCSRIHSLGWQPSINIKEGFMRTIKALESQPK